MTSSLFALRCGGGDESPFTDAGGRAGSAGTAGSAGSAGSAVAGSGGSAGSAPVCTPEASEACTGENDCAGTKVCLDDGSGFSACDCSAAHGGEGGVSGAGGLGSGAGGAADAGASGRSAGGSGPVPEGGNGGASDGGASNEAGAVAGGAAGVATGGDSGAGGSGPPVTLEVTDLVDSYVDQCNENERHELEDHLSVDADPCVYRAFIRPAEPLPIRAGAIVESAILRLVCDNEGASVDVYAVSEAWNDTTLEWATRPELGALQGAFNPVAGVIEIDLTNLVQSWVDAGTAFGVAFTQTADNGSDYLSTEAADASQRPVLSITYSR